jgi:hypothetical protein
VDVVRDGFDAVHTARRPLSRNVCGIGLDESTQVTTPSCVDTTTIDAACAPFGD